MTIRHNPALVASGPIKSDGWGWAAELTSEELERFAPASLELLRRGNDWVNRRVETIELIDDRSVRLQVSVDFRLPEHLPGALELVGERTHFVPLTYLPRRTDLTYFDVKDEDGRSLPLLNRTDNGMITGAILGLAAERALDRSGARSRGVELAADLRAYLAGIPTQPTDVAKGLVRTVLNAENRQAYTDPAVARIVLRDAWLRALLAVCVSSSVVHVPLVARGGQRRILKISWEERWRTKSPVEGRRGGTRAMRGLRTASRWMGWRPYSPFLERPHIGDAESYHVQIAVPPDVEMTEAGLVTAPPAWALNTLFVGTRRPPKPPEDETSRRFEPFARGFTQRAHLYVDQSHQHRIGFLWIRLRASRQGFLSGAVLTAMLVTAVLTLFAFRADAIVGQSEPAAALLLLVPALIAGFLVRSGEHAMSRRLLTGPRRLTTVLAALPLLASALLVAMPADEPPPIVEFVAGDRSEASPVTEVGWDVLATTSLVVTLLLVASWVWPRAGADDRRTPPAEEADTLASSSETG